MKKRTWLLILAAAAAAAAALFALHAAGRPSVRQEIVFSGGRDTLRAELTYDAGTRTLRGTQTMTVRNRTEEDLGGIVLRLAMNAQEDTEATVSAVRIDGQAVSFAPDADDPTVLRIDKTWPAGSGIDLECTVMIRHGKTDGAAIVTLPQLAMYENGAWREDAPDVLADVSYAQAFDHVIRVGGEICAQMEGARDASFALMSGGKTQEKDVDGVLVRVIARDSSAARTLMACAQDALGSLEAIGIAYPFPELTIAQTETAGADGDVYSGLAALSTEGSKEEITRCLTRLIARQTFGILIENDPWQAPWLSVSLASCAELMAFRQRKGERAYEERYFDEIEVASRLTRPAGVCVGAGTASFGSAQEMTQVLRDQGAAMLMGIELAAGREAFSAAMARYIADNAGGVATQEALERALSEQTGSAWDGYLDDELRW